MRLADVTIEDGYPKGREGWTFPYRAEKLAQAAAAKAAFHKARFDEYTVKANATEAEIRAKGMELREHQVTGGAQFQAVVDGPLAAQLSDVRSRRDRHEIDAKRFATYAGAFAEMPSQNSLHLTIADVEFFGLHDDD